MASALPVGNFGTLPFRGQLSGKPLPANTFLVVVPKSEHKGRLENSIRVGSVGRGYFETRWPQFVPPESADQAIAKVLPFPAPTDCKSADECVPCDNWFGESAGHARS
jgi:hypothetical protein